jgi:hypothetical protein
VVEKRPYTVWSTEQFARWIDAADTFGRHLAEGARDYALERIPESASDEAREVAKKAALDALYGVMMVLEGITFNAIDEEHRMEYVVSARIKREGETLETIELSPDGDGLCMGFHRWLNEDFE